MYQDCTLWLFFVMFQVINSVYQDALTRVTYLLGHEHGMHSSIRVSGEYIELIVST